MWIYLSNNISQKSWIKKENWDFVNFCPWKQFLNFYFWGDGALFTVYSHFGDKTKSKVLIFKIQIWPTVLEEIKLTSEKSHERAIEIFTLMPI